MKRLNLKLPPPKGRLLVPAGWIVLAVVLTIIGIQSFSISTEKARLLAQRSRLQSDVMALEAEAARLRPIAQMAQQAHQAVLILRASEASRSLAIRIEEAAPEGLWLSSMSMGRQEARLSGNALRWQAIGSFANALRKKGLIVILDSISREEGTIPSYRFSMSVITVQQPVPGSQAGPQPLPPGQSMPPGFPPGQTGPPGQPGVPPGQQLPGQPTSPPGQSILPGPPGVPPGPQSSTPARSGPAGGEKP